jgi:hypothetical protein
MARDRADRSPHQRILDPPGRSLRHGLVDPTGLPHWFLDKLEELGIEPVWCHPEEWAINSLAVRPGRVLMSAGNPRPAERLERRGVEVVTLPYEEIQKNGGGIHCSTMELRRDPA